jgi:putative ABC transport system permease protein
LNISTMVFRNITHRRGRAAFTLLGIVVGIAAFVVFLALSSSLRNEIKREAAALGADLIITPKGSCAFEQISILTGEQIPVTITMAEVEAIAAIEGLVAVPLITEKSAIRNRPVPVTGILPEQMKVFRKWKLSSGDYFNAGQATGIIAGYTIAMEAALHPGDELVIRGERLPLLGVLEETGKRDDTILFIPLPLAQRLYGAGDKVSYVAVRVDDIARTEEYISRIKEVANVGVISDEQMLKSVLSIVGTVSITMQLVATVALLAAAFGIANTMMAATYERKREIGILQAMGAGRGVIFTIFLLESGFYGVIGGIAGVISGLALSSLTAPLITRNTFTAFIKGGEGAAVYDPHIIFGSILFSMIVALLAGLYPAWRAARLSPVEAISYE